MRELIANAIIANKSIREAKRTLEPLLQAKGLKFHGLAIRRPRRPKTDQTTNPDP